MYQVLIKRKWTRRLTRCPLLVRNLFWELIRDLQQRGPVQHHWPNYSRLNGRRYHCHLKYRYVACWTYDKINKSIEVTYVGRRENAPY